MSEKRFLKLSIAAVLLSSLLLSCSSSRLTTRESKDIGKMGWKKKAERALHFMNRRKYNKAIQVYEMIIATPGILVKQAAWARYEIGFCYRMMKKYTLSLESFQTVLKKYPQESAKPARILAKRQIKKLQSKKYDGI